MAEHEPQPVHKRSNSWWQGGGNNLVSPPQQPPTTREQPKTTTTAVGTSIPIFRPPEEAREDSRPIHPTTSTLQPEAELARRPTEIGKLARRVRAPFPGAGKLLVPIASVATLIVILFWANMCNLFGSFYKQGNHVQRAAVPVVDFDGGPMGDVLLQAASQFNRSYGFPTYITTVDPAKTSPDQLRHDVFSGKYWTAFYVAPGASDRWLAATNGTAGSYDPATTLVSIEFSMRYYAFYEMSFTASNQQLMQTASGIFLQRVSAPALANASSTLLAGSEVVRNAYLQPIQTTSFQASLKHQNTMFITALLNTVGAVIPILMMFFWHMAINGISNSMHLWASRRSREHHIFRIIMAFVWPLIAALCSVGWTFTFKGASYHLPARSFFAAWAVTWLYELINYNVLDMLTTWVPISLVSFCFLTWVLCQVTAGLVPPELTNYWYRTCYFFPSNHWWGVLITIYTQGGVNHLRWNLPVLFVWWLLSGIGSIFATRRRIRLGRVAYAEVVAEGKAKGIPSHKVKEGLGENEA